MFLRKSDWTVLVLFRFSILAGFFGLGFLCGCKILCLFLDIFGRSCVEWLTHGTVRTVKLPVHFVSKFQLPDFFGYLLFPREI